MCKNEPGYGNFTCLCRSGYTGDDCDVTINPCTANGNPCSNGANCVALQQGRFKCDCLPGLCEFNDSSMFSIRFPMIFYQSILLF